MPNCPEVLIHPDNVFRQLKKAVRDGRARDRFPSGTVLPDAWEFTNFPLYDPPTRKQYKMPLIIRHYQEAEAASGLVRPVAILQRQHALPNWWLQFDHQEPRCPHDFRDNCGYNRYAQSALWQWLNSAKPHGAWWGAQNPYDEPPSSLQHVDGHMAGCSEELLSVLEPIIVTTTAIECVEHERTCYYKECYDYTPDYFFLPSMTNIGAHYCGNDMIEAAFYDPEGDEVWEDFRDGPRGQFEPWEKRAFVDPSGRKRQCWLRTEASGRYHAINLHFVQLIKDDGSFTLAHANESHSCAPACAIVG